MKSDKSKKDHIMTTWIQAFENRSDLQQYGDNALGLFALALKFGFDDLSTIAANAITDGSDDKKCDIIHVDKDEGVAVVAQCYFSTKPRAAAPSNKASDLNTAASWLLQRPSTDLPEKLRPAALEMRQSIIEGTIEEIHFWYVHNLPESENARQELVTVEHTAESILSNHFPGKKVTVRVSEVGRARLEEWYNDTQSPILVSDSFSIRIPHGFEVAGKNWKAFVTAIPGAFIHGAYKKYGAKLFSANVRDYLGSRRSDANINNGIKRSAQEAPSDFWVFNNGLTILVHTYAHEDGKSSKVLSITGMSIVNGAQTTGALGSLSHKPSKELTVPARFVVTTDTDTVFDIIQYNNSQNKVTASDFRSRDKIQRRLKEEIAAIPHAQYQGGRRGGTSDAIRRNPEVLPSYTVGQAFAALQLDPDVAYNQKSNIWASDTLYSKYFNDDTTGAHIVFAYSLLRAVESRKARLVAKSKSEAQLTDPEAKELQYFRQRGSTFLLTSAIASCLETIVGKRIGKICKASFGNKASPAEAERLWNPIVDVCSAFCPQLEQAFTDGLKNKERIRGVLETFQSLVQATAQVNQPTFKTFGSKVKVN
jgi:hypothetical protein